MNWFLLPKNPLRHAATAMVMVALAACGTHTDFGERQRVADAPITTPQRTSPPMPKDLRAAYIASVQREAPEAYAARAVDTLIRLENPAQQFVSTVDHDGLFVMPDDDGWHLGMRTRAVGCENNMIPVTKAVPEAVGNRVDLRREGLSEWYLNGPLGLEHGYVLAEAPACAGPKRIALAIEGDLTAVLEDADGDARGEAVRLVDENGQAKVSYTDLFVVDAAGKTVPAWLLIDGGEMAIVVDDAQATYPLAIDPLVWLEQAKLTASDGAKEDWFGISVALAGDTALVGAYYDDDKGTDSGSVYVFVRSGVTWTKQAKLTPNDGAVGDKFGRSVSLSGDTALVGANFDDDKGMNSGSAYVFVRNGTQWTQQAKLTASDGSIGGLFGVSASVSGDTALVGAYASSGSAYVFVRNGTTWTEQAKLTASDGASADQFSNSVSLAGDTALVGAHGYNNYVGSAYVFVRNGTTWTEQAKLTASDGAASDAFGISVSLAGDTALVGSCWDDDKGMDSGSAYIFVRNGTTWTEQAKLTASDGTVADNFGISVSLSGDMALVGAHMDDDKGMNSGSAYVFVRNGTTWTQQVKLEASDGATDDLFGISVSLSGDTALVGAYLNDDQGTDSGSAYVFGLGKTNREPCTDAGECVSGFCVDGVCCNSFCGNGDVDDCQACSIAAGGIADGMCSPLAMGTVCRSAAGVCDLAESCDGVALDCPADAKVAAGTECRAAAGDCDVAESCDGTANDCTADANAADGTTCPEGTCTSGVCISQSGTGGSGGGGQGGSAGQGESSGAGNDIGNESGCNCRVGTSSPGSSRYTIVMAALVGVLARRRRKAHSGQSALHR